MENPLVVLVLFPVLSVGPAFLFGGWVFHRLVPRSSQKRVGYIWIMLGLLLGPILSLGLDTKSLLTMPLRGSLIGLPMAPLFGWHLNDKRKEPEWSEPQPIGSP